MKHFNKLSPAELERLALLLEEMGEAQQIIGKILRHGYMSYHPHDPAMPNRMLLENEVGHVLCAIQFLLDAEDIDEVSVLDSKRHKSVRVHEYLHHQK